MQQSANSILFSLVRKGFITSTENNSKLKPVTKHNRLEDTATAEWIFANNPSADWSDLLELLSNQLNMSSATADRILGNCALMFKSAGLHQIERVFRNLYRAFGVHFMVSVGNNKDRNARRAAFTAPRYRDMVERTRGGLAGQNDFTDAEYLTGIRSLKIVDVWHAEDDMYEIAVISEGTAVGIAGTLKLSKEKAHQIGRALLCEDLFMSPAPLEIIEPDAEPAPDHGLTREEAYGAGI